MLIGDTHIDVGYLVMIIHLCGLSNQGITYSSALEKHDVVLQSEGEHATTVHHGSQCDICQREVGTALTDAPSIEMVFSDKHLCPGIALAYLF